MRLNGAILSLLSIPLRVVDGSSCNSSNTSNFVFFFKWLNRDSKDNKKEFKSVMDLRCTNSKLLYFFYIFSNIKFYVYCVKEDE